MAEQWVSGSQDILKGIDSLASKKDKDRLELINSIMIALNITNNSIRGWSSWIQNLDFMSRFNKEELKEIEEGLLKLTRAFIEYDIEQTNKYRDKIPRAEFTTSKRKRQRGPRGIYT
jgi:hypothetical protein